VFPEEFSDVYFQLGQRMQRYGAFAIYLALSGCVIGPSSLLYMPTEVSSTMVGSCPEKYKARLFEHDGVALDFLGDPSASPFRGTLRLDIPQGQTATFLHSRVTIASLSHSKSQTVELRGRACEFAPPFRKECEFGTPITDQEELLVTVPPLVINGDRYDVRPIRFSPQRKPTVCWLSA